MNSLQSRLAALRRRLRLVVLWRGLTGVCAVVLACAILAGFMDWRLHLPALVRAILLCGTLAGAGFIAYRFLIAPLAGRSDDLTLALRVEEHYPVLNDALASTVQFLKQPAAAETAGSPALRREAVQRALRLAEGCNFNQVVDGRGVLLAGGSALVAGAVALLLLVLAPGLAFTALARFVEPFGQHSWTRLTLDDVPRRIALGKPFAIHGVVEGVIPKEARIELQSRDPDDADAGSKIERKPAPIKLDAGVGTFDVPVDMTRQRTKFLFRVWANDAVYPSRTGWREVEVVPPPALADLDGKPSPQVVLAYPTYTALPKNPEALPPGSGRIEAVAGTHVSLRAAVDRPIQQAWIEYQPEHKLARLAALVGTVSVARPLPQFAAAIAGHQVWGKVPAHVDADGQRLNVDFMPWVSGSYLLRLQDAEGLERVYEWELRIFADPVPVVTMERPASNQDVLPEAEITLSIQALDDKYAVRSVYVEYQRKDLEGNWLDPEPRRLPLYDALAGPEDLPAAMAASKLAPGQHLNRVHLEQRWPLKGLAKEGEVLVVQACATDFNDVVAFPQPGRSPAVELRLVNRAQLARKIDEGLGQVQQELLRLKQMQEDALAKVKEVQDNLNKPGFRANQELVEVEQKQKEIQARINNEEGLQSQLKRLKQTLRDNKLPASDIADRLGTLSRELERITQEDLQQIESNLAEARKQVNAGQKQGDKQGDKEKKDKGPLDKARTHQEKAQKGLEELVQFMDPWASMQQVKGTARKILEKQREVKQATEKVQEEQLKGVSPEKLKGELEKIIGNQNDLADQTNALKKTMETAQKTRADKGDAQTAKLLKEALDMANKGQVADKMREAKDKLSEANPKFGEALQNQKQGIDELEKILAALNEQRSDEEIQKLLAKQRKEEQNLEEFRERQELLQKKVKEEKKALEQLAKKQRDIQDKLDKKLGDPEKLKAEQEDLQKQAARHKRELERLAEEQRKLQEDVQKKSRELARLQAGQAGQELNRAARDMERAAEDIEKGADPEDAQNQALERIEEAQAKLQDAEDELAREQLAKIADRLKGLKERQDSATAEGERIHKESIGKRKHWTEPTLRSLAGLAKTQKVLGEETGSLKEKLKGAKVFEHILDRAAQAMKEAGKSLDERREKGVARQDDDLEKEELADELQAQERTQRLQKEAGRRLDRLLEAIKDEPIARRPRPKKDDNGEKKEPEGGLRPGDGIANVAQLKALRDEQKDLNERTKDFVKRFPAWPKVDEAQKPQLPDLENEISNLQMEQAVIQRLFEELTQAPADKKGENP